MSVRCSEQAQQDPWLVKLRETKERKVAAWALANKMARIGWAVMVRQEDFRSRRRDPPCPDLGEPGPAGHARGLKAHVLAAVKTAARAPAAVAFGQSRPRLRAAPLRNQVGTKKRPFDRTNKQHLRDTGLARVKKRDGIPGSRPRTGQPTDRGIPVTGHGATRPRRLDQTSTHATHQGLRPRAAPLGRTHDRNRSSMQTRRKILARPEPSTHVP
jgi:hypothetical protein